MSTLIEKGFGLYVADLSIGAEALLDWPVVFYLCFHTPVAAALWSRSACEQLIQLRELFGQTFRRTGEGFVESRCCGVEFV